MEARIRVLVADDSSTMRHVLTTLLAEDPRIEVVGVATDGVEAVSMASRLRPDVITLDILMPRLDGLAAIGAIMASNPSRILVITSITENHQVDLSFKAFEQGALEVINKPLGSTQADLRAWSKRVCESVKLMAEVPVIGRGASIQGPLRIPQSPPRIPTAQARTVELFGIAASTGGPPALATILGGIPGDVPFSVLIAQHIREGFSDGMLRYLKNSTALKVEMLGAPTRPAPGTVYLPPDGHDLEVDSTLRLRASKSTADIAPSADRLLESMARVVGKRAVGAVLTGMGDDGAAGLLALRKAGGVTMAQDEATSVVFGMPHAAIENGAAQEVVPLKAIAPFVCSLLGRKP